MKERIRNNVLNTMKTVNSRKHEILIISMIMVFLASSLGPYIKSADAGPYLNSAHGDSSYGVKRSATGFPNDYTRGLCAHCHEQHASIDEYEPEPIGGIPSNYTLFYDNYISQTDNFCFQCHKGTGTYQTPPFNNYNYSYRAGGDTSITCPNSILSAFSFIDETGQSVSNCGSTSGSSHKLTDIGTFITGQWGYSADSNPCDACHNPHSAERDPHSSGSRGWPVSRPSQHDSKDNNAWGLWGDDASERMSVYTSGYQAPYRKNSTTTYEPDGGGDSSTQDGSTLTDYVTLCTDCHNLTNTIYSNHLGRNLRTVNWNSAKHGKGVATLDSGDDIMQPYQNAQLGSYVMACTDCHEPHGTSNVLLVREEVNGAAPVTVLTEEGTNNGPDGSCNKEWVYLCGKCHTRLGGSDGHVHPSYVPPDTGGCSAAACHDGGSCIYTACGTCHFHGADSVLGTPYGEQLF